MNEVLKLLNTREIYTHTILFKVYLETRGNTSVAFRGNLQLEVKELFEDDYNYDDYSTALNYLYTEGYTKYYSAQT